MCAAELEVGGSDGQTRSTGLRPPSASPTRTRALTRTPCARRRLHRSATRSVVAAETFAQQPLAPGKVGTRRPARPWPNHTAPYGQAPGAGAARKDEPRLRDAAGRCGPARPASRSRTLTGSRPPGRGTAAGSCQGHASRFRCPRERTSRSGAGRPGPSATAAGKLKGSREAVGAAAGIHYGTDTALAEMIAHGRLHRHERPRQLCATDVRRL